MDKAEDTVFKAVETYIEENNIADNATNKGVAVESDYPQDDTKTVLDRDVKWSLVGKRMAFYLLWVIFIDFLSEISLIF